jgi:zinc D-Ala-D-Ala dipeptidase
MPEPKRYSVGVISRRSFVLSSAAAPLVTLLAGCELNRNPDADQREAVKPAQQTRAGSSLVELIKLDPKIRLDLRYATTNNFTGRILYATARAFLVEEAARALVLVQAEAQKAGFGLSIFDAYRPWRVTKQLWDATVPAKRDYVANPRKGSRHNRGCAVDLTLCDLKTGSPLPMPSGFDDFSARAHRDYAGGTPIETANRATLERIMRAQGFVGMSNEWWHFDFAGWEDYPVLDVPFENL